jgi:hypothetical protein
MAATRGRTKGSWRWMEVCSRLRGRDPRARTAVAVEVDVVSSGGEALRRAREPSMNKSPLS